MKRIPADHFTLPADMTSRAHPRIHRVMYAVSQALALPTVMEIPGTSFADRALDAAGWWIWDHMPEDTEANGIFNALMDRLP